MPGNLPSWSGAEAVYGRAYRILDAMGKRGHVTVNRVRSGRNAHTVCHVSEEMRALIGALNMGDEEQIKGLVAQHLHLVLPSNGEASPC